MVKCFETNIGCLQVLFYTIKYKYVGCVHGSVL